MTILCHTWQAYIPFPPHTSPTSTTQIVTRDERGPFIAALHRLQRATMLDDFTRTVNPVLTLVYTLTAVGAQECAKRAILLLGRLL